MQIRQLSIALFGTSLLLTGCQAVTTGVASVVHNPFSNVSSHPVEQHMVEMICLWEEAEGIGLDQKPTRGFAGQVMFFAANTSEPVPVNGDVEIFLFDDLGTTADQSKPLHTFKFEKEAFQAFITETNLGIAYQLFLPYVRKSSYSSDCSLRVKITPSSGRSFYSKMASVNLSGPESPQAIARAKAELSAIELASLQTAKATPPPKAATHAETAAYFGASSVPKPNLALNLDRQRLKSAMTEAVHNTQPEPNQLPTNPKAEATPIKPLAPTQTKHPLLGS